MQFVADLHIHSKFSRATSPKMDIVYLDSIASLKGVQVLGTGDFTHPEWFEILKKNLKESEPGLYQLKNSKHNTRFLLSTEISCIYSKGGKVRKIHILVLAPNLETVSKINQKLSFVGNLASDGRPILGLDAKELLKIVLDINPDCLVIPAHLMTPWFGLFGSRSGFDSIKECFEELSEYIWAGETGLSADPKMLWRIPDGRKITLISNSDSHSPNKIAREANVFDVPLSYFEIIRAIKEKDKTRFLFTIEFFPEEGKYHYDGHRKCNVSLSPQETKKYNGLCPVCGQPLTIGVASRVEELSDKPEGFQPQDAIPYRSLIPLEEIIAQALNVGVGTKEVTREYDDLIKEFGSELNILLWVSENDLKTKALPEVAEGIIRARKGEIVLEPGYDGVYGKIKVFSNNHNMKPSFQKTLF